MKKVLSIFLALALVLSLTPANLFSIMVSAATTADFASGSGTESDPYLISTKTQLNRVRNYLNAHFKLISNIIFDGESWKPIGSFEGSFDGNGFTIENLQVKSSSVSLGYVGFFEYNYGTIKNLHLENCQISALISASSNVGAFAEVGGIVGSNRGVIENCYVTGKMLAKASAWDASVKAGGIAGSNEGTITNCYNNGTIDAWSYAYGSAYSGGSSSTRAGGIVGLNKNTVTDCYNTGDISAEAQKSTAYSGLYANACAGGIVGENRGTTANCYNTSISTAFSNGSTYSGGIVGYNDRTTKNCYFMDSMARGVGSGTDTTTKCTAEQLAQQSTYAGFDFENNWYWDISIQPYPILKNVHYHMYDNSCDTICNECYIVRTIQHTYSDGCDTICNVCGYMRSAPHSFKWVIVKEATCVKTGLKYMECAVCHITKNENTEIAATGNHSYDNDCDDICNICEQPRTAPHNYEWIIDKSNNCGVEGIKHEECTVCHTKRNENTVISATGTHTFTDSYDSECDICKQIRYQVTFNGNGGTSFATIVIRPGDIVSIPTETPTRSGYVFDGWSTTKGGDAEYQPGDTLSSLIKSITLYAQWNKRCASCGGNGIVTPTCSRCYGSGSYTDDCGLCNGEGGKYVMTSTCTRCNGSGATCNNCGRGVGQLKKCSYCGSTSQYFCSRCGGSGGTKEWRTCTSCSGRGNKTYTCNSCPSSYSCTNCKGTGEVIRKSVSTPSHPVVQSYDENFVTLQAINNGEYSIDGVTWQESPTFEGLEGGHEYIFYQRYAKTDTTLRSEASAGLRFTPKHTYDNDCDSICNGCGDSRTVPEHNFVLNRNHTCDICKYSKMPDAPVLESKTYYSVTLVATDGFEYSKDGVTWQASNVFVNLSANTTYTFYQRVKESTTALVSETSAGAEIKTNEDVIYTVVFKDWNGTVIRHNTYHWGDTVTIPADPSRPYDDNYMYHFAGWDKTVTACYGDAVYTATYSKTKIILESIAVTQKPIKTTYVESTLLDDTGMVLTLYYNNNTSETVTTGWVSEYDFSRVGVSTIKVTYGGKECTYDVTVIAKTLVRIAIESKPNQLEYLEGDAVLDTEGLAIRAYYDNDTSEVIAGDYTVTGYSSTPGTKTITVNYSGKKTTFTVKVIEKSVTSIAVTKKPNKLTYLDGDSFDKTGMVVTAYYNNNTSGVVTDYTISGYSSTVGSKTVTVSYGGKTAAFTVTVKSRVPSTISSSKHTISGNNISKIAAGTTVSSLLSGLNEGSYCKVYKGNTQVGGNTLVGTGMVVKIMDGNTVKASYTVIVTGDTNGDGNVTVTDMIAIKAHVLKKSTLSGAYATAADTNGDKGISITDFIQVKAKILGKGTITAR